MKLSHFESLPLRGGENVHMYIGSEQKGPYKTLLNAGVEHLRFGSHHERYYQVYGPAAWMLDTASMHVSQLNGISYSSVHQIGSANFQGTVMSAYYVDFPFSDRLLFSHSDGASIGFEMTIRDHGGATRVHVFECDHEKINRFAGWSLVGRNICVESYNLGERAHKGQALDWGLNLLEGITTAELQLTNLQDADITVGPSPFVRATPRRSVFRLQQ